MFYEMRSREPLLYPHPCKITRQSNLLGVHAGDVAKLSRRNFKECLSADAGRRQETRFCLDGRCDTLRKSLAGRQWHVQSSGKEAFQNLEVAAGELGNPVIRQGEGGRWFGGRTCRGEEICRECTRTFAAGRRFFDAIAHHQGPGRQISQALVIASGEDGDRAYRIGHDEGNHVDVANEIPRHGLEQANRASRALDHAYAGNPLAGRAAVPERFKQREVSPVEKEDQKNVDREGPLLGKPIEGGQAGQKVSKNLGQDEEARNPDQVIHQQSNETAADAGDRHLDGNQFRGFNAKLI